MEAGVVPETEGVGDFGNGVVAVVEKHLLGLFHLDFRFPGAEVPAQMELEEGLQLALGDAETVGKVGGRGVRGEAAGAFKPQGEPPLDFVIIGLEGLFRLGGRLLCKVLYGRRGGYAEEDEFGLVGNVGLFYLPAEPV